MLAYIFELLVKWLGLFAAPAFNLEILWIIIPVWMSWILTEIYQEKKKTSFGNAISNGVIPFWVGIDWGKTTYRMMVAGEIGFDGTFAIKMGIIFFMIAYGLTIISVGVRAMKITRYIGRIREVTYFALVLTPLMYNIVPIERDILIAVFLFFPLFYVIMEIIDRYTPHPRTYDAEDEDGGLGKDSMNFDKDMPDLDMSGFDDVGQQQMPPNQQMPPQYPPSTGYPPSY